MENSKFKFKKIFKNKKDIQKYKIK